MLNLPKKILEWKTSNPDPLIIPVNITPFAVRYKKIRNHLRQTATNNEKVHSYVIAKNPEHFRINQIQLQYLHLNQHSITLLGINMHHSAYKRKKNFH